MSSRWVTRLIAAATMAWAGSSTVALADPPARVARISFSTGSVSFRPGTVDEWSTASLNYPLTIGDHLWTDSGARSELQLDTAVLRVAPATELSVLNLDDHVAQVRLTQGTVSVRVRAVDPGDTLEIDTPAGAVSLLQPGLYRLDVNEAGDSTIITVRQGEADMANGTTDVMVTRSQSAIVSLDSAQPDVKPAVRIDEFEDWCLARDRRTDNVQATRYVSAATIGYEDLDANGSWQTVPQYGAVWVPRVRGEWAPYRFGRWAWVEPWGWTWIDDEPWGFAPFHYGRWAFLPSRGWAWVPGAVVARPVYAPALVAFVGGPNWAVSARAGAPIGWFPLGPREVYVPAYRATAHLYATHQRGARGYRERHQRHIRQPHRPWRRDRSVARDVCSFAARSARHRRRLPRTDPERTDRVRYGGRAGTRQRDRHRGRPRPAAGAGREPPGHGQERSTPASHAFRCQAGRRAGRPRDDRDRADSGRRADPGSGAQSAGPLGCSAAQRARTTKHRQAHSCAERHSGADSRRASSGSPRVRDAGTANATTGADCDAVCVQSALDPAGCSCASCGSADQADRASAERSAECAVRPGACRYPGAAPAGTRGASGPP